MVDSGCDELLVSMFSDVRFVTEDCKEFFGFGQTGNGRIELLESFDISLLWLISIQ